MSGLSLNSIRRRIRQYALILFVCLATLVQVIAGENSPIIKMKETLAIDSVGDGRFKVEMTMPAGLYTSIKTETPNTAALLRRLGWGQSYAQIEDARGTFDDNTSTLTFEYVERGLAQSVGDGRWSVPVAEGASLDMIGQHENNVTFTSAYDTPIGVTTAVVQVQLPKGVEKVDFLKHPDRLEFNVAPPPPRGDRVAADFSFDSKDQVMSCLAKCYGDPRFNLLWVGRTVFKNTGDQILKDYRVRYRVVGYSEWSGWQRSRFLLPGQTAVHAYFPLFDLEKLARLDSALTTAVEVEYEYTRPDGTTVRDTDQRRVRLLSRNQVIFSSLDKNLQVGWHDKFNYGPMILASFVTCNDPVIQQLGGIVSGRAGGVAASSNNDNAVRFMAALYNYLGESGIAYQTPPGGKFEGQFGQHVKHGRDVLRNRAGTCIDLAILFASACEAVGLDPVLYLVPGHCFPAVKLPGGGILAVEATMIGRGSFDDAVNSGMKSAQAVHNGSPGYLVDIREMHDQGVDHLDLPRVESNFLESLGYPTTAAAATGGSAPAGRTPAPSAPQQAAMRYAVLAIHNTLDMDIHYEVKIGDGEWQACVVEAGKYSLHGCQIDARVTEAPRMLIRFDYDLTESLAWTKFQLQLSIVEDVNEQTLPSIRAYRFSYTDGGDLGLFSVR